MTDTHVIVPVTAGDAPAIAALLREADLPHDDFVPHLAHFLVARDLAGEIVGAIGAEICGSDALLRSFVVATAQRRVGLGQRLLDALEHEAERWGVVRWWLLTTTAETYFLARGFRRTPRSAAPAAIAATAEFRDLCPSVAACLSRERGGNLESRRVSTAMSARNPKPAILILCTGNSCRSHLAEGILRATAGDLFEVHSAGSKPAGYVHPLAIRAMAEIGIDISRHQSKHMNDFLRMPIETVITVCGNADQACPVFPGQVNRHHWPFDDPAHAKGTEAEQFEVFRRVRDEIRKTFEAYVDGRRDALTARAATS